jgi:hypothetical protein
MRRRTALKLDLRRLDSEKPELRERALMTLQSVRRVVSPVVLIVLALFLVRAVIDGIAAYRARERFIAARAATVRPPAAEPASSVRPFDPAATHPDLVPDRRFLTAFGRLARIATNNPGADAQARPVAEGWELVQDGAVLGTVPKLPAFAELWAPLRARAAAAPKLVSSTANARTRATDSEAVLEPELLEELHALDARWAQGERTPEALAAAARALVLLELQKFDSVELADTVAAQALAVLAMAQAQSARPLVAEECLLAYSLGYSAHALSRSRELAESDPVRAFLQRDGPHLAELAQHGSSVALARYLQLVLYAERLDKAGWAKALDAVPDAKASARPLLATGFRIGDFFFSRDVPFQMLQLLRHDLLQQPIEELPKTSEGLMAWVREVADGISKLAHETHGTFLDGDTLQSYYEAALDSALERAGIFFLDQRNDLESSRFIAASIPDLPGDSLGALRHWYLHLVDAASGRSDPAAFRRDMAPNTKLGVPALVRALRGAHDGAGYGDFAPHELALRLFTHLDSRPTHREAVALAAHEELLDLALAEDMWVSVVEVNGMRSPAARLWLEAMRRHTETLKTLVQDPGIDPRNRAIGLEYLRRIGSTDPGWMRGAYEALIRLDPGAWSLYAAYDDYLEETLHDYPAARAIITRWVEAHDARAGFEWIYASTRLARLWRMEGHPEQAWKILQPVIDSGQGGALSEAVRVLEAEGKFDEAEAMALDVHRRYPGSPEILGVLCGLYWRNGRVGQAAEALSQYQFSLRGLAANSALGEAFLASIEKLSDEEAEAAFGTMVEAGIEPSVLAPIAKEVSKAGRNAAAFRMASQLKSPGLVQGQMEWLVDAYTYKRAAEGEAPALAWLRSAIPKDSLPHAPAVAFDRGEYELVWTLVEEPGSDLDGEQTWLLRAASAVQLGLAQSPHREALLAHYQGEGRTYYHEIGRYLVGLASKESLLTLAQAPERRIEIGFFLGLKAESEGRYREASTWYRLSMDTGDTRDTEYRWSLKRLTLWTNQAIALDLLAKERA